MRTSLRLAAGLLLLTACAKKKPTEPYSPPTGKALSAPVTPAPLAPMLTSPALRVG